MLVSRGSLSIFKFPSDRNLGNVGSDETLCWDSTLGLLTFITEHRADRLMFG